MISRQKLLDAAVRVYEAHGFRGATTRRIADEAGVNEITIFRLFGSKAALIDEALRARTAEEAADAIALPAVPRHPERELTDWCTARIAWIREHRALIAQTMSELEERPETHPCGKIESETAALQLRTYMQALAEHGFVDYGPSARGRSEIAHAAGAMLMAALFGDAMRRDVMPEMYPQPAERAPALYVRLFLRALGVAPGARPPRARGADSKASTASA